MKLALEALKFLCAFPVIVVFAVTMGLMVAVIICWALLREAARWAWDLGCLAWIALGEPDARGDAEKDGGSR